MFRLFRGLIAPSRAFLAQQQRQTPFVANLSTSAFAFSPKKAGTTKKAAKKPAAPEGKKKRKKVAPEFRQQMSERAKSPTHAFQVPYIINEPLASIINQTELPRPQIVKHVWEYIKLHGAQDPNDKRLYRGDANLSSLFGPEFTIFDVSKHLSKYIERKS